MSFIKRSINYLKKNLKKSVVIASVLAVAGLGALHNVGAKAEFYPDRQPYDYNKPCNPNDADIYDRCGSLTGPVFNSFINTPSYGDERAFVDARMSDQTAAGSFKNVLPDVNKGSKEVVIRLYIHNNANQSTNASGLGIAKDTKVKVALPTATANVLRARGYISASNASMVEDTVDFTADGNFKLEYVPGSATLYDNDNFAGGVTLSDDIVGNGATIGSDQLDGNFKGCFDYEAVVQIKVKVVPQTPPTIDLTKQVRISGQQGWQETVTTTPGQKVDWLLTTTTKGEGVSTNMITRDVLPPHVKLVSGSVKWIDASQNATQNDTALFDGGLNLGNYNTGSGYYITFSTTTLDDFNTCEVKVTNLAYSRSDQNSEISDSADLVIKKDNCTQPVVKCDSLTAISLTLKKGETSVFTVFGSSTGTTITGYRFLVNGQEVKNTNSAAENTYTFTATDLGKYIVEAKVKSPIGEFSGDNCVKTLDVVDQIKPIYRCDSYSLSKTTLKINEQFTVKVKLTAKDGAKFKYATFTFGDEAKDIDKFVTNKVENDTVTVNHSYAKAGTYGTKVKLTFDVDGKNVDIEDPKCTGQVKVNPEEVKGVKTLPNTGAGDTFGILMAVAVLGTLAHRRYTLKNLGR
ncbi:hypothetical protein KC960_02695 [Candidatus Saccharibacteria bacterium]|nr:hypothetical protein [Candidatus Saccharibacteria bacterium]